MLSLWIHVKVGWIGQTSLETAAPLSRTLGPQLLSLKSSESTVEHHGPFSERPHVNGCYCVIPKPGKERTKPAFIGTRPVTKSFSFRSSQDDLEASGWNTGNLVKTAVENRNDKLVWSPICHWLNTVCLYYVNTALFYCLIVIIMKDSFNELSAIIIFQKWNVNTLRLSYGVTLVTWLDELTLKKSWERRLHTSPFTFSERLRYLCHTAALNRLVEVILISNGRFKLILAILLVHCKLHCVTRI